MDAVFYHCAMEIIFPKRAAAMFLTIVVCRKLTLQLLHHSADVARAFRDDQLMRMIRSHVKIKEAYSMFFHGRSESPAVFSAVHTEPQEETLVMAPMSKVVNTSGKDTAIRSWHAAPLFPEKHSHLLQSGMTTVWMHLTYSNE